MNYLYKVNYDKNNEDLYLLESKSLFEKNNPNKIFFSNKDIKVNTSIYIKERLEILCSGNTLSELIYSIAEIDLKMDDFKVVFMDIDKIQYDNKLDIMIMISHCINGEGNIKSFKTKIGVTFFKNMWYLGIYTKNDYYWHKHNDKPYSYSNAMGVDLSHTIINIALNGNRLASIIDPCCGIGTVVCEAIGLGANIVGSEINPQVVYKAKKNLQHFGYPDLISQKDIHDINQKYDVSIVDIPYGIMSKVTITEQLEIIKKCYQISDKLILISHQKMDTLITQAGFKITNCVKLNKTIDGRFSRTISICEK